MWWEKSHGQCSGPTVSTAKAASAACTGFGILPDLSARDRLRRISTKPTSCMGCTRQDVIQNSDLSEHLLLIWHYLIIWSEYDFRYSCKRVYQKKQNASSTTLIPGVSEKTTTLLPPKGVNLHCALCDDVLFTTPLDLAAGLLDVDTESESSAYALACRFQSAVCVAAAQHESCSDGPHRSEMVYEKLQEVLLNLRDGRSGRSSPLKEFLRFKRTCLILFDICITCFW